MTDPVAAPDDPSGREGPPPILGTWGLAYAAVIGWLALLILLFYFFGWRFTS